jgi:decaprenylphospho-beta-D-erythro-pentofuranosid-2-ulose 2-reductase
MSRRVLVRRILALGATSGIAREALRCFAAEGAHLFLVARDAVKLTAIADDLKVRGAAAVECLQADLADSTLHPEILDRAFSIWQGLDAALIAHGTLPNQRQAETNMSALRDAIDANYVSAVLWLAQLANRFEQQRSGVIAVIGSVAGDRGRKSNYIYGSAKAALTTYAAGLRLRLEPAGVHLVLIKPGWVSTPMTAHVKQNALFASAERAGRDVHNAIVEPRPVIYVPWFWKWLMLVIRLMPEPIFKKLNL